MVRLYASVIAAMGIVAFAPFAASQTSSPPTQTPHLELVERTIVSVGDNWTYRNFQINTGNTNRTWVETVVSVTDVGYTTQRVDRISSVGQDLPAESRTYIFGEGLYSFPLYVGKSWQSENVRNGQPAGTSRYTVVSSEIIDTAVGKLETLKIETVFTLNDRESRQFIWYSPTVGHFVRLRYANRTDRHQVTELTNYDLSH